MIVLNDKQGSAEWIMSRIGVPTASNFSKIITAKGQPSASARKYLAKLTAEWVLGVSMDEATSGFMERGTELEDQAIAEYEFKHDVEVVKVGLCLLDDGSAGASPDGLVGEDGLIEVKCKSAENHMLYVLEGPPDDHATQIQGQLWITGRKWCDLNLHHPVFPKVVARITRDEPFIEKMAHLVREFAVKLAAAKERLAPAKAEYEARFVDDEVPAQFA